MGVPDLSAAAVARLDQDLARLAEGDRTVFRSVFATLSPVVTRFCARRLGGAADADDAAQVALEKIFSRASDFEPGRAALPWALAIAAWECATVRTRARRARTVGLADGPEQAASEAPADEALAAVEDRAALRELLTKLTPAEQAILEEAFEGTLASARSPAFRKRKERALTRLRGLFRGAFGDD